MHNSKLAFMALVILPFQLLANEVYYTCTPTTGTAQVCCDSSITQCASTTKPFSKGSGKFTLQPSKSATVNLTCAKGIPSTWEMFIGSTVVKCTKDSLVGNTLIVRCSNASSAQNTSVGVKSLTCQ